MLKQASRVGSRIAVTGSPRHRTARPVAAALALVARPKRSSCACSSKRTSTSPSCTEALAVSAAAAAPVSRSSCVARRHDGQAAPWVVVRCSANLQVLVEGRMRSPGHARPRARSRRAVHELREQHHVVIIHAPSLDEAGRSSAVVGRSRTPSSSSTRGQPPRIQFGDGAAARAARIAARRAQPPRDNACTATIFKNSGSRSR